MENTRPLILITNDDSINAPGIHHLAECVRSMGDVFIVAPAHPHSGQSAAMTVGAPLRISELPSDKEGIRIFTVNGTPVDCVKLALHAIVPRRPDVVFAGINHGSNSGVNVTYSGTMGAVLEGCIEGIPSVGFSLTHHSMKADFSLSTAFVAAIAGKVIEQGLPEGICLNVNIPARVMPEGIRVCRSAHGKWVDSYQRFLDPPRHSILLAYRKIRKFRARSNRHRRILATAPLYQRSTGELRHYCAPGYQNTGRQVRHRLRPVYLNKEGKVTAGLRQVYNSPI